MTHICSPSTTLITSRPYVLADPMQAERAAHALARGAVVGHAFGNIYMIATRPDAEMVRRANVLTGRAPGAAGSVTTTRPHIPGLFDWSRLPFGLNPTAVMQLMDALYRLGPFGFRGPAAAHLPDHLTSRDHGGRSLQVVAPGYRCPSNRFLARALELSGNDFLAIATAGHPRCAVRVDDAPVVTEADGLMAAYGHEPDFVVLAHHNEVVARRAYPLHESLSPTVLAFHMVAAPDDAGRPRLILEQEGSLPVEHVQAVADRLGFGPALDAT
jgi:hypothetical protein